MTRLDVDDMTAAMAAAMDERDRKAARDEQRGEMNNRIRSAASWPSARGLVVTDEGEVVAERDEKGRFAGGLDQGARGGDAAPAQPKDWIRSTFGEGRA